MIKSLFTLLLTCFSVLAAQSQYWQQRANFYIEVALNDTLHTLDGFEKITYTNHSPDTLTFIWFHLWPNAYKNDKTAFSEQMLQQNKLNFYFSNTAKKGYINRLNFSVNGTQAKTEDHPQHIDITKLILPVPLLPGNSITISTPFHVQLPYNFSRGGHVQQSYQITQWYPKPAVYDQQGWHPMPYLDQGEFYSEFGDYEVHISLPQDYAVAATGNLQTESEKEWLLSRSAKTTTENNAEKKKPFSKNIQAKSTDNIKKQHLPDKTITYHQKNIIDFAWFADKNFIVNYDTIVLNSGKQINAWSFYMPDQKKYWSKSMAYVKRAITLHSEWIGEYPYETVTAVQGPLPFNGGMEYPTITLLSPSDDEASLDDIIFHEVGHNWMQAILASNERKYPWMDEGMNSYYDNRYINWKQQQRKAAPAQKKKFPESKIPADAGLLALNTLIQENLDQPINTSSESFTEANYGLVAYIKTADWMKKMEDHFGKPMFDSIMQQYYQQWKFKHPQPKDFKNIIESTSQKEATLFFEQLNKTGPLYSPSGKKKITPTALFNLSETDKKQYLSILPAIGYNKYDGFMIGAAFHNYQLPLPRFRFFVAPMYGTNSKSLNGLGRMSYHWYPQSKLYQIETGVAAATFHNYQFDDGTDNKLLLGFSKIAPYVKLHFKPFNKRSTLSGFLQLKAFFIKEDALNFGEEIIGTDTFDVVNTVATNRQLLQLQAGVENKRALYPYSALLQLEQNKAFYRLAFTGNYFFNYASQKGGLRARFFAGGFFYSGAKTINKQFETDRYHLNLTGANGYEDYTYSNYFTGRNEFEGFHSQQIMMRDGGFKVRTDLLSSKVGKSDRWLAAINLTTDIPDKINPLSILPFKIPLKAFLDIGSFAESWDKDANTGKILFDAGLQVSLLKSTIHIYIPLFYSNPFKDYINSTLTENKFWKKISFSIDIQSFNLQKISKQIPF